MDSVCCCVCDKTFNAKDAFGIILDSIPDINGKVMKLYMCSSACYEKPREWQQAILSAGHSVPCVVCKKAITDIPDMPYELIFNRYLSQVKYWIETKGGYACSPECVSAAMRQNPVEESKG